MKNANNLNTDLKDNMSELTSRMLKLQIFQDDSQELMRKEKEKNESFVKVKLGEKDEELKKMKEAYSKVKNELDEIKAEWTKKVNDYKFNEIELENKLKETQTQIHISK